MSDQEENIDFTLPEVRESNIVASLDMLPKKSREIYERQYQLFSEWSTKNHITVFSENVLLGYFAEMAQKYSPPTLWSYYSMLKATLNVKNNIDISIYKKLILFLKQKSKGYSPKLSKTLSQDEVINFMLNAPDSVYLMMKVCTIFGIAGACRADELVKLRVTEIEDKGSILIVNIPKSKIDRPRTFIITAEFEGGIKPIELFRKYLALRPSHVDSDRFFLSYREGRCTIQPVGIHTIGGIPSKIASYLSLPDATSYTGHCFRRTSASLFPNGSGRKKNPRRNWEWRNDSVADYYVEESVFNKRKAAKTILGGVHEQEPKQPDNFLVGPSNTTNSDKPSYVIVTSEQPSIDEHAYRNNLPSSLIIKSDIEIEKSDLEESSELGDAGFKNYRDVLKENENLKAKVQSLSLLVEDLKQELFLCKEREVKLEQIVQGVKELVNQDMHIVNIKQEM